jgi:hypothetical protein
MVGEDSQYQGSKHVHQRSMAWQRIAAAAAQEEGLILSSALLQLSRELFGSKTGSR